MCNERDKSSVQVVEIINLDDLEVASPTRKRATTEKYITPSKRIRISAMKPSDGSHLQLRRKRSTAEPPAMANVVKKMTEKTKNVPEDMQ